jgi:hypothetical protein
MPFSLGNWIAVIVLDVLLRAASFIIPIYMLFAIPLSFIHLATLMSFSAYVRTFALAPRVAVDKTLVWTNVVFAVVFVTCGLGSSGMDASPRAPTTRVIGSMAL